MADGVVFNRRIAEDADALMGVDQDEKNGAIPRMPPRTTFVIGFGIPRLRLGLSHIPMPGCNVDVFVTNCFLTRKHTPVAALVSRYRTVVANLFFDRFGPPDHIHLWLHERAPIGN